MKNPKIIFENHRFLSSLINENLKDNGQTNIQDLLKKYPEFTEGLSEEELKTLGEMLTRPPSDDCPNRGPIVS